MNPQLNKLFEISKKSEKLILGLMSGTSLDGLDIALCKFSGNGLQTKAEVLKFETYSYSETFKEEIKSVFSKETVDLQTLCLMNEKIGITYANIINETLLKWEINNENIDLIASHGQTIYHAPKVKHQKNEYPDGTLQIGDGDHIAWNTGIITVSDFRQKHVAAGGEGAPLAIYGDYLLFSHPTKNRILLNIGGIANFTFLPAKNLEMQVTSTDIGPGNTLMDQYMYKHYGLYYDLNAEKAKQGLINKSLLSALLNHPFFEQAFPKSTGPELFNLEYLANALRSSKNEQLSADDILATLCEFTAASIAHAINTIVKSNTNFQLILSGGGIHNPLLIARLKYLIPDVEFANTSVIGINPDAKEALLFALLANETICGDCKNFVINSTIPAVSLGKISLPK